MSAPLLTTKYRKANGHIHRRIRLGLDTVRLRGLLRHSDRHRRRPWPRHEGYVRLRAGRQADGRDHLRPQLRLLRHQRLDHAGLPRPRLHRRPDAPVDSGSHRAWSLAFLDHTRPPSASLHHRSRQLPDHSRVPRKALRRQDRDTPLPMRVHQPLLHNPVRLLRPDSRRQAARRGLRRERHRRRTRPRRNHQPHSHRILHLHRRLSGRVPHRRIPGPDNAGRIHHHTRHPLC